MRCTEHVNYLVSSVDLTKKVHGNSCKLSVSPPLQEDITVDVICNRLKTGGQTIKQPYRPERTRLCNPVVCLEAF